MALSELFNLPASLLSSRKTRYKRLGQTHNPDSNLLKTNLTGSALRGAIAGVCGIAFLPFGYDQGVLGAVIGLPSFRREFDNPGPNLEGIIAAIYDIGCFAGAIIVFLSADGFGRKGSIMWGCWIMVIAQKARTTLCYDWKDYFGMTASGYLFLSTVDAVETNSRKYHCQRPSNG